MARVGPRRAGHHQPGRPHQPGAAARLGLRGRPGRLRPSGRKDDLLCPGRDGGDPPRDPRTDRRARGHHPSGEVLREGRQATGNRHQPPVVHPQRRPGHRPPDRPHRPGRPNGLAPAVHANPLHQLDRRTKRRLADQPSAVLRRSATPLVSVGRRRRADPRHADRPRRGRPPGRPVIGPGTRLQRVATGTARRLRRRHRRHGHLGHVVALPADRLRLGRRQRPLRPHLPHGPPSPGPRHHPDLAVLHRRALPL